MRRRMLTFLFAVTLAMGPPPAACAAADQPLALLAGFNFKGILARTEATSVTLLQETPAATQVFAFDRAAQAFRYQLRLPGGGLFGSPLPLSPLEGYVVKCDAPASWTVPSAGDPATLDPLPALVDGFNFVALPAAGPGSARALLLANPGLESLFRWSAEAQAFAFVLRLPDGALFGTDFDLAPADAAYFLRYKPRVFDSLELTPASLTLPVGGTFDLSDPLSLEVRARYADGGSEVVTAGLAWTLLDGSAGALSGTVYTASGAAGTGATLRVAHERFGALRSADLPVTLRAPLLLGLSLSESERTVAPGSELVLADEFTVNGIFEGGAVAPVDVMWTHVSGGGTLDDSLFIAPSAPGDAVLRASRQEGAIAYTVDLTLRVAAP